MEKEKTGNEEPRPPIRSLARKVGRVLWFPISVISVCLLGLVAVLLLWSRGQPKPFVDKDGKPLAASISEKIHVDINGMKQGMFIKSKDVRNPVLLYLHGGMPEYFLTQKYPTGLEEHFTVVWWEQRGAGLSYNPDIPPETMTLGQFVSDTLEVTNYLRNRFGKEKIYLMGHSGGSFIGVQAAARAPELYYAYVGVAQMSNQLKSERLAYEYMLKQFKENGNTNWVRKLQAAPVTMTGGTPAAYVALRDDAMHSLGIGTTRDMKSKFSDLLLPSFQFPEYTLGEKINLWRGKIRSGVSSLWTENMTTDLAEKVPELDLPVYFLHGVYDYTCSYTEARSYFEKLKAPLKGFYAFEQSAHSPMFEEPEKTVRIMQEDVLVGANNLADARQQMSTFVVHR